MVLDNVPVATVDPFLPTRTLPRDPPECVARYAQYLKDKYKRMSTLPDGDWPPSLGRQYTRLAMIEQERELPGAELVATMERDYIHGNIDNIVKRKKAIQLPEIFLPTKDGGQQLKILMDGAPGVGKSTLSRKVCKDWASGELLKQYHLVILLPLRQPSIREATSIEGLIEADDPDLKSEVVRYIQKTSGEHVLLIVDGYDELSYQDRTKHSLFLIIIRENKFPKCSVLVTSRPYASDYLQQLQSVNRHVEILGFTEEQIEHCITENIPDKAKATELVQTLKERQDITSLCYIPLNCAIVLYVYKMAQWTLPNTLTKLYEIFILNSIKRHASITGNDSITMGLHTLAEIPESFEKHLNALSKLAYDGLIVDKMVFSIMDIKAAFPYCSDFDKNSNVLSLMTVFKEFTTTGEELSYQFLHLTIQEFLAARWAASQLSDGELLKFFQDHLGEERYRMVLLFLAGISQLKFPSAVHLFRAELRFKHSSFREYSNWKVVEYFLFLVHLIYESQNFSLFHNLARAIVRAELFAASYHIAPFDCLVLAHFLAWCDCSLKLLDLSNCNLTNQSLEIMHRVNLQHCGTTQVEEVNLSYNPMAITKLSLLSKLPMFERTHVLKACDPQYPEGISCVIDLICLLNMRHLTTLEISVKEIGCSPLWIYLSLNIFRCRNTNIDSQNAVRIFRSLEHNTSLEELDLSRNSQLAQDDSEAVGCAIERMLNVNRTLRVLNLSRCNLTDPIVKGILAGVTKNPSLVTLHMNSPKLSGSCAVTLFQQMTTHPTVSITAGEVNVLGVGTVEMDRGTMSWFMGDLIPENCVEFFKALNNSGLNVSNLIVKDLTDQSAKHIGIGLAESQCVQALKLSHSFWKNKSISSTGAMSIFRSLEHNTSLEELDLSENSQLAEGDSEAVGCTIERMLNVNRTLKILNLSGCNVTDPIVKHIVTGLTKNTSLVTLDIGSSKLSGSCAVSLFQQMTTHPTLSSTVGEVNLLGVGRVKIDSGTLWCVMGDLIPENCVEFFRALNNSGLKVLKLTVQDLTDQTAEHFAVGLAESQLVQALKLKTQYCNIGSVGAVSIFRSLEHNTSLEELDLSENSQLAEGDSESVGCAIERMLNVNRTLKVLNLSGCNVTDPIVKHIQTGLMKNTSLVTLDIGSSQLSGSCAVSLFQQMTTHPTLSSTVGEVNVLGVGWVRMDRGTLRCVICDLISENCVEFFRALNNSGLKVLKLTVQDLTDQTAEHFAVGLAESQLVQALKLKTQYCNIGSVGAVSIFRSLEHNTSLEELDLSENSQLADGDSESVGCAIEKMLNVNRALEVLNLAYCGLNTGVVTHIFRSLEHNTSLEELDLSRNSQLAEGDSEAVGCAIERMLNVNTTLKVLNLSGCRLDTTVNTHIADGLANNASLAELNIGADIWSRNNITSEGWVHLFKALCNNTPLKKLNITHNDLGVKGSVALSEMLSCNKALTKLNLGWCDIPEAGLTEILTKGLLHNTSLKKLNISGNDLWIEGSVALAEMLTCNKSLTELNLRRCDIPEDGLREIARGLLQSTTLQTLKLWSPQQSTLLEAEIERITRKLHTSELEQT